MVQLVSSFMLCVHIDINGRRCVEEPRGFAGFVCTCITIVLMAGTLWGAGCFDCLFGKQ